MTSNSPSPSRASRNRSKLRAIPREIVLGGIEGALKALSMIDDNQMVVDLTIIKDKVTGTEYVIRLETE